MSRPSEGTAPIRILALGNLLARDDGIGPYCLRLLEARYSFPRDVELEDLGTPGFDLLPWIEGVSGLIILDAVRCGDPPGTVWVQRGASLIREVGPPRTSPHQPTLREALLEAEFRGTGPEEVVLIGVEPQDTSAGTELSPMVRRAIPRLETRVLAELQRLGHTARPRPHPRDAVIWWE